MAKDFGSQDRIGLLRPAIDAHSLGLSSLQSLLVDCGLTALVADEELREAVDRIDSPEAGRMLRSWIVSNGISALGFSYRLDPAEGIRVLGALLQALGRMSLLARDGGPVRGLFFAGLPETCDLAAQRYPEIDGFFRGDESPAETLQIMGIARSRLPASAARGAVYDEARLAFGRDLVARGDYKSVKPLDRSGSPRFGRRGERLGDRIDYGTSRGLPPLIRAHAGPYLPRRAEAVELFTQWAAELARGGMLDVLSIGSSQLSQSAFGEDWEGRPNGGGVPIASAEEYARVWEAARPMLVRTYAGSRDLPRLAKIHEESLDIAWHAYSFWWFSLLDGRGPNSVLHNLRETETALRFAATTGKPIEPNVPHHFAFRGADDASYVAAGYIAAKAAKAAGIKELVLQVMLNTPRGTWGVQDLAKARALAGLARGLEGPDFRLWLQPRGGLDYFSRDENKAKAQLAAVTALMDDIEPGLDSSPQLIHVVSYSEATRLADPAVIQESARICRFALDAYRKARAKGEVDDMGRDEESRARTKSLTKEAADIIAAIESSIENPYSPEGMYEMMAAGFFPLPTLAACRDEFARATAWNTRLVDGAVRIVGEDGMPLAPEVRLAAAREAALLRRKK